MTSDTSRVAWVLTACTGGLALGAVVLSIAAWQAGSVSAGELREDGLVLALQFPGFPIIGLLLATRRPENPIGWLFVAAGVAIAYATFADEWGRYGLVDQPGALPAAEWVLWTGQVGAAGFVLPAVFGVLLFPDGHLPSERWRPMAYAGAVGAIVAVGAGSLRSGPLPEFSAAAIPNPAAIDGADPVLAVIQGVGMVAIAVAFVAAMVSLFVRYRRGDRHERGQLRFFGVAALGLFLTAAVGNVTTGGRIDDHVVLSAATGVLLMVGLPAAVAAAILWRGLYDLDRLVRRWVVYGALWLVITVVYVAVAWAVGVAAGDRLPVGLAVLLTVIVTLVFEPSRRWLGRLADHWVFGPRPDSYDVTAALGVAVDSTDDLGALAGRLAELAVRSVDARWVRVTLAASDGAVVAGFPADLAGDAALTVPLTHRDEEIGAIACGPKHDGPYGDADRRLLDLLAREAGLAANGLRLAATLAEQVETVSRQAAELATSRSRIVAAQESERRRIERNIHDGAQQDLVALIAKVRLARDLLGQDPTTAAMTLEGVQRDAARALHDIRDLAQGIHPTVLTDQGLVHAAEDRAARLPIDVRVHADAATREARYDDPVEGAAYFVVSEALANVLKHADATRADVHLSQRNGHLCVEVSDDGRGIASGRVASGTGLVALADRLDAVGGTLHVDVRPGGGTTLAARLPARRPTPGPPETTDG